MARCRAVPVIDIGPAPRWPGSGAGSPGAAILGAMFGSLNRYRWVVPVYLAAVAALGFGVWRYGWLQALDQLAARAESDLALASDRLSTQLQGYQEIAVIIADHPELARIDDPEAASRLLLDVADKIGATNVIFAGIDGVVLASAQTPAGGNVSAEPAFQRALQGAIGAQHGLRDGRRSRIVAAPAFAQDGKVRGALLVEVDLNKVEQAWRGDNPAVFFTDAGGEVLVTNRSELLFWRRPEGQAGLVPRDADAPPFGARREGRHEIWTVGWGPYLPETGLHLSRALPVVGMTAEVLVDVAPARRLASLQAAAVVAGCLAFGALLYLATERRRALASANRKLEARVAERTSDLSTANRQLRREVAERMEAEAALKKAQADLVQAGKLSALGQMSAGISHELNQPLMAIRSFAENGAEFLNRGRPEPAAENLSRISDMARRMGRIIRNLRAFARNEAEPVTRVDLVQVVTQAVELTEAQLRARDVTLDWEPPANPVPVCGGEVRLVQVLVNLITNAADAMAEQDDRRIRISLERVAGRLRLTVRDIGPGIEDPERLFEPFYTTKAVGSGEGMGLGLSISYGLVQSFGGEIRGVNMDDADGGAAFMVDLDPWVEAEQAA